VIVGPKLPSGNVIFCDDIRLEASGKQTIVGMYGSEMYIQASGVAEIPFLYVIMRLMDDPDSYPRKVSFRVTKDSQSGSEIIAQRDIDASGMPKDLKLPESFAEKSNVFVELTMAVRLENLKFDAPCRLRARVYRGKMR
jgi:hypothetical protein